MFGKVFFLHNTKQYPNAKIYHQFKVKIFFAIPSSCSLCTCFIIPSYCINAFFIFWCNTQIYFMVMWLQLFVRHVAFHEGDHREVPIKDVMEYVDYVHESSR
jgi:hypothetical protein